jgi:hypothetical protein
MNEPILIPIPIQVPARDCVLVDGHRYCREDDQFDHKRLGVALLLTAALLVYVALLFTVVGHVDDRNGKGNVALVIGLLVPLAVCGLILVLR